MRKRIVFLIILLLFTNLLFAQTALGLSLFPYQGAKLSFMLNDDYSLDLYGGYDLSGLFNNSTWLKGGINVHPFHPLFPHFGFYLEMENNRYWMTCDTIMLLGIKEPIALELHLGVRVNPFNAFPVELSYNMSLCWLLKMEEVEISLPLL